MSFCVSPQPASLQTCSGSMFGTMLSASSRSSLAVAQEGADQHQVARAILGLGSGVLGRFADLLGRSGVDGLAVLERAGIADDHFILGRQARDHLNQDAV